MASVTYQNTSDEPSTAARTVSFTVNDGASDSVAVEVPVNVTAVNDVPEAGADTYILDEDTQLSVAAATTIDLTTVNDAPAIGDIDTLTYTENASATVIDSTVTLSDADDTEISGATTTISSGFTSGDVLGFTDQNGISGSYDSSTGVLSLSGTATVATYQAALRSVTYHSCLLYTSDAADE